MERIERRATILVLCLCGLLGGLFAAGAAFAEGQSSPGSGLAELVGIEYLPDGRILEAKVLVDPRITDPETALHAVAPNSVVPPRDEVSGQFALWRKWHSSDIPVVVQYNEEWDPWDVSDGIPTLLWAIGEWNSVNNSNFRFQYGGLTDAYASSNLCSLQIADDINSVRFSYLLPDGVLGATCAVLAGGKIDGVYRVSEFDLQLDALSDWSTAAVTPWNAYDLNSVMLHELGHALGLDHTNYPGATMLPSIGPGEQQRTISPDDAQGVRALYGVPEVPTATPTATRPPATPTPTPPRPVSNFQVRLPALARDESGGSPPPPPPPSATATPTRTVPAPTATPTMALPTPTPTQAPAAYSELYDPNESEVLFNDIQYARLTVVGDSLDIYLQSWSSSGFSFYDNDLGDESYLALRFYFGSTGILDDDLYLVIHPGVFTVYRTTGTDFTRVYHAAWTDTGDGAILQLPLILFPSGGNVGWDVTGAEARFSPRCSSGSCSWFDYDRAPDILQPKPRIQLP